MGLLIFGWVMVYSSSALFAITRYHDQFFFLKRQLLWSVIGIFGFLAAMNTPLSFWQKNAKLFYGGTVVLLLAVLIFGPEVAGARRWLRLGPFRFQPSEMAKLAMVFVVADYMDRRQSRLRDLKKGLVPILFPTGLLLFLIFIEPDLGTPVLMSGVLLVLLILAGARWRHLVVMGLVSLPLLAAAIMKVRYRLDRFFAYLDPWSDPYGRGYQLVQSLLAMGSGGILGRGLGNSRIKISHLPDAHTDFCFFRFGRGVGVAGNTHLRGALFIYLCQGFKDTFSSLMAAGIGLMIGFQALINMGVASGLFPTKGMPLPFLSFGGSSLVITFISLGILVRISHSRPSVQETKELR